MNKQIILFNQFVLDVYLLYNNKPAERKMILDLAYMLRGIALSTITAEFRDDIKSYMDWENYDYKLEDILDIYDDILNCAIRHRYIRASQIRHAKVKVAS